MYDPLVRYTVGILRDAGRTGDVIRAMTRVSERTQRRIAKEKGPMWQMKKEDLTRERGVGRPSAVDDAMRGHIDQMLSGTPGLAGSEILRRLRFEHGYNSGKTAVYDYVKASRPAKVQLPVVLFEGVAGEFAQHDFGEVNVTYENGVRERLHFYAGRLKFSRSMQVKTVPNQEIESVIRGMLSFAAKVGGMALINVWDRPKTVVTGMSEDIATGKKSPIYNRVFEPRYIGAACLWSCARLQAGIRRVLWRTWSSSSRTTSSSPGAFVIEPTLSVNWRGGWIM